MPDMLLGIDYWTGRAKATIINDEGEVLSYVFEELAASSALPSLVMVDEDGDPTINNAYNLMYRRATEQVK